jgi:hypothetical protein
MSLLANLHRSKGKAYKPSQFDPFAPPPRQMSPEEKEAAAIAFMKSWK